MTIIIDPKALVSPLADLEESIRGTKIVIGAHTVVDSFVKIKPTGGSGDCIVGEYCVINSGCIIYTGNGLKIGDTVAIAANCVFAPVNHEYSSAAVPIRDQGFKPSKGGIVVEDDVWIGAGCVILDGSILRRGCVIAAMSLVRGEVAPYSIQGGNPLQLIGWRR